MKPSLGCAKGNTLINYTIEEVLLKELVTQIYYCITEYRLDYSNMNTVLLFCVMHCCSTYCIENCETDRISKLSIPPSSAAVSHIQHALLCSFACREARNLNSLTSHSYSIPYCPFHCDVLFTQGKYFALLVVSENIDTWYNILRTLFILSSTLSLAHIVSELSQGL